jgi:hypothetical protein
MKVVFVLERGVHGQQSCSLLAWERIVHLGTSAVSVLSDLLLMAS